MVHETEQLLLGVGGLAGGEFLRSWPPPWPPTPRLSDATSDFITKRSELNVGGHGRRWRDESGQVKGVRDTRFFVPLISASITRATAFELPQLRPVERIPFAHRGHKNGGSGDDDDKIGECKNICESVANLEL